MKKLSEILKKAGHKYSSVVVVAAGNSTRMGEDKLSLDLEGKPVLAHTLLTLNGCDEVDEIVLVTREDKLEPMATLCRNYGITKCSKVILGGDTRTESALAGVCQCHKEAKVIAIHDGARPLVPRKIVNHTLRMAAQQLAAAPAVKVNDTVRIVREGVCVETPERENLAAMQTPQAFDADLIKAALTDAVAKHLSFTDDCAAVEAMGVRIYLTEGSEENIKITTPLDIAVAKAILEKRRYEET